ncbi:MAG TPA: rhodanese-like domain-containing protein [Ilumatobacteraceae bacterium]|nr:rhodanese-like domain-containing protein [Ilumatobacteraceae bacterium]
MTFHEISVEELAARLDGSEPVTLIDVRQPDEYADVHVPGATLVPLGDVAERIDELAAKAPLVLICRSGARSAKACEVLSAAGIDATNVVGGTLAWVALGYPTQAGDAPA